MNGFKEKLARFMAGRYGTDALYTVILTVCIILAVVNLFVRSWVIWLAMLLLAAWATFRAMSRNIYKRSKENQFILKIKNSVGFFLLFPDKDAP